MKKDRFIGIKEHKKFFSFLALTIIILVAGLILFRIPLFYTKDELASFRIDENVMNNYQYADQKYYPVDESSSIWINGIEVCANNIELVLEECLDVDATIYIYNDEAYLIKQVMVKAGEKNISIDFDNNITLKGIRIKAVHSANGWFYVGIPQGKINIYRIQYLNLIQKNTKYVFKIIALLVGSIGIAVFLTVNSRFGLKNSSTSESKKDRQTNSEILRIICMFFLILHHYSVHGGASAMENCNNKIIASLFLPIGKICFNAFVAISMWFFVEQKFKFERFFRLWMQVFFYSFFLTALSGVFGKELTLKNIISSFFPIAGNSHGFAAAYLLFYLFLPFLQLLLNSLSRSGVKILLYITCYAQIVSQVFGLYSGYTQNFASELGYFVFSFIVMFYLKKWPHKFTEDKKINLALFSGIWLLLFQAHCMTYIWGNGTEAVSWVLKLATDESSVLMIVAGFCLFFFVKNIKVKTNVWINKVAGYTFGVLLIHDHNFFRTIFWDEIVAPQRWFYSSCYLPKVLLMGTCIFYVCSVIDYLRKSILEKFIINSLPYKKMINFFTERFENEKY